MTVRPLKNNVIFKFLDETTGKKGSFVDRQLASGIILPGAQVSRQKVHRWGLVVAAGPEADGLNPGDYILIESMMWMEGVKLADGEKVWKTDSSKVLAVTNDIEACQPQGL